MFRITVQTLLAENKELRARVLTLEQNEKAIKVIHEANKHHFNSYYAFIATIVGLLALGIAAGSYLGNLYIEERIQAGIKDATEKGQTVLAEIKKESLISLTALKKEREAILEIINADVKNYKKDLIKATEENNNAIRAIMEKEILGFLDKTRQSLATATSTASIKQEGKRTAQDWYVLAIEQYQGKNFDQSILSFNESLAIDPLDASKWIFKGNILSLIGEYKNAVEAYDKAIEINPNDIGTWSNKGFALRQIGYNSMAIEAYQKALDIDPQNKQVKRIIRDIKSAPRAIGLRSVDSKQQSSSGFKIHSSR